MNYGFVPGIGDPVLEVLRDALALRTNTEIKLFATATDLATFLGALALEIPALGLANAGDLILGAHGTAEGELLVGLDSTTPSPVVYEALEKVNTSRTVQIPAGVGDANTNFRLASCLLGTDDTRPFLQLLKQALGNPKSVTAPRFLHTFSTTDGKSFFESMRYEYQVVGVENGTKPLPTRDAVVGKFGDFGFQTFDGTEVPGENWEKWVPPAAKLNLGPANDQKFDFDFPVATPGAPVTVPSDVSPGVWRCRLQHVLLQPIGSTQVPADDTAKRKILELALPGIPNYQSTHPYPIYKRYHFNLLEDFIKGWNWTVTPAGTNKLRYAGSRYIYVLTIPVTKPGTNEWIYNYYPATGAPTINFTEDNQPYPLFGIV